MSPIEGSPAPRDDAVRGSLILLVTSAVLFTIAYIRATGGGSSNDARLATGGAFLAALTLVVLGLRGGLRVGRGGGLSELTETYLLVGLVAVVGVLALMARAASPLWHGTFIAGWAGVMAGLASAGLFRPGPR